ncbi:uncharacterized protein LOC141900199 isoform X2 [Tubulanus polymorphus]|uniref:uncharacterized protein LOC141900199 isoform X2 n=1 Tax=Tubulanus polymorphus TaxID=672921 RepID=UPI003DA280B2
MRLTTEEAYHILELPFGANSENIRSNYKKLALKWHPDKHKDKAEATQRFQQISAAYKRLQDDEEDEAEDIIMTMDDMFELFQQIFFAKAMANAFNGYSSSDDDYDDDDDYDEDDDDDDEVDYLSFLTGKFPNKTADRKNTPTTQPARKKLTPEEIKKNADELVAEEEKEKRKAEKRRAKKKRQREKKKLDKQQTEQKKQVNGKKTETSSNATERSPTSNNKKAEKKSKDKSATDEEELDTNAAFFTKVRNKKKKGLVQDSNVSGGIKGVGSAKNKTAHTAVNVQSKAGDEVSAEDLDPIVLRSRQLAIRGNELANTGHYAAAVDLFTEAIKLDPKDFRFFGNRSYCYDRITLYEKALRDADKAISLAPDWPKGYFRKGRALAGLKLSADAEQAFMQVLKLDRNCEDAQQELIRVRTAQITEMGFSQQQAEAAIRQYGTVQGALDSLLAGVAENSLNNDYSTVSEDDEFIEVNTNPSSSIINSSSPPETKMDPTNPEGLTALWVGNVLPEVTEKKLTQMFSRYGSVTSVRCLPEKYCAFVNFKTKESAGRAMHLLQSVECGGQRLLIKFPDNPIERTAAAQAGTGSVVIKKSGAPNTPKRLQKENISK